MIWSFGRIFKLIEQTFFFCSRFTQEDDQKDEGHNKAFKVAFLSTFLFIFFMRKIMANFERFNYVFNIKRSF